MGKKTLQHFKDEVAQPFTKNGYRHDFEHGTGVSKIMGEEEFFDTAAERYAQYLACEAWKQGHIKGYDYAIQPKESKHLFSIHANPYIEKEGTEEGDACNREGCQGVIEMIHYGDGCSCHVHPPCSYCVNVTAHCPVCDWEE